MQARHKRIVDRAISRLKLKQQRLLVAIGRYGNIQHVALHKVVNKPFSAFDWTVPFSKGPVGVLVPRPG